MGLVSRLNRIDDRLGISSAAVLAVAFGLDAWPAAMVIGPIAGMSLGQVLQLRRFRNCRKDPLVTMLPATDCAPDDPKEARDLNRDRRA